MRALPNSVELQRIWFLPVFVGFGVLASLWPLHNWSPDGYAAAPTAVSMLHGGVLKATGAYCALRFGVQLMPEGGRSIGCRWSCSSAWRGLIYAALIAFRQTDLKYIIGFSSVSHLGLVLLGIAALNELGLNGAGMELFAGGVMTGLMFALVGMVYERAHRRDIRELNGLVRVMPLAAVGFVIGALTLMGMPGLPGFIAEIQIFMGLWQAAADAQRNVRRFDQRLVWRCGHRQHCGHRHQRGVDVARGAEDLFQRATTAGRGIAKIVAAGRAGEVLHRLHVRHLDRRRRAAEHRHVCGAGWCADNRARHYGGWVDLSSGAVWPIRATNCCASTRNVKTWVVPSVPFLWVIPPSFSASCR